MYLSLIRQNRLVLQFDLGIGTEQAEEAAEHLLTLGVEHGVGDLRSGGLPVFVARRHDFGHAGDDRAAVERVGHGEPFVQMEETVELQSHGLLSEIY